MNIRILYPIVAAALPLAGIAVDRISDISSSREVSLPSQGGPAAVWKLAVMTFGGDERILVSGLHLHGASVSWSPDGKRIAYVRNFDGDRDICTYELTTGEEKRIKLQGDQIEPFWDPASNWIVFRRGEILHKVRPSGSGDQMIMAGGAPIGGERPMVSKNGQHLGYATASNNNGDSLFVRNTALNITRKVGDGTPVLTFGALCFSPDSKRIAFRSHERQRLYAPYTSLYVAACDGSNKKQIFGPVPYLIWSCSWSPDGSRIAIAGDFGIRTVKVNGTGTGQVIAGNSGGQVTVVFPSYSPDGKQIAYMTTADPVPPQDMRAILGDSAEDIAKAHVEPDKPVKSKDPWVVEPDATAKGRFGIVRTKWHEQSSATYHNVSVYLPGKRDQAEYKDSFKMDHSVLEGEYDIFISGMLLEKVPVKAGHVTRILMGGLRFTAVSGSIASLLKILDSKDRVVTTILGGEVIALPVGTYHVKVGTRTIKLEIKENEVTDF